MFVALNCSEDKFSGSTLCTSFYFSRSISKTEINDIVVSADTKDFASHSKAQKLL
jgi:hypothetical protein